MVGDEGEGVGGGGQHTGVRFVDQEPQLGTGHAIQCARAQLEKYDNFLVLSGDVPLVRRETIEAVRDFHFSRKAAMTILTAEPENAGDYGRVERASSSSRNVQQIVEKKMLKH